MNPAKLVTQYYIRSKEKLLITGISNFPIACPVYLTGKVSANNRIRDGVRELVQREMQGKVTLINLDFQPWEEDECPKKSIGNVC